MNKNTRAKFKAAQKEKKFKTGSKAVISQNKVRNMQMVVSRNKGEDKRANGSVTVHEPIDRKLPFLPYKKKDKHDFEKD